MTQLVVSKDGKIACGRFFASCQRSCIPGAISLLKADNYSDFYTPDEVAFSSFDVVRFVRHGAEVAYRAGDHAAIAYNDAGAFFSAVVVRCDTWAVQWAVERSACLANADIFHLSQLCANTVCGVATPKGCVVQPKDSCIFVATRFDALSTSREENKEWRHFLAAPRVVRTGLESEGIAHVVACGKNSFVLLTLSGSLAVVTLNVSALKASPASETSFYSVKVVSPKLQGVNAKSRVVVHSEGDMPACAAVYSIGGSSLQLVHLESKNGIVEDTAVVTRAATGVPTDAVAFAGAFHLCVCSDRARLNVQFFGLVPGSAGPETMTFDPLTASHAPLAVVYDAAAERLVLLSSTLRRSDFAAASDAQQVGSLLAASVDFSAGPGGQSFLEKAAWASVSNPYRHHGPQTSRSAGQSEIPDEGEDAQLLQRLAENTAGRWTPLTLCYALAATGASGKTDVAVFSVETAPFLHTRLIKQWHNATAGLKEIVDSVSAQSCSAVVCPWNPRHVRRALRLLSQRELSSLLHCIAAAISASERVSSPVTYYNATTSAVELALHVISLSRQMGAVLKPEDVKAVAIMLRACREGGHELLRYASRMELLMESSLQQRAMNRVLRRRPSSPATSSDVDAQHLANNFYGISAELQTERTLHTRYTSNTWAQHLAAHGSRYKDTAAGAQRFLKLAKQSNNSGADSALSDWKRLGTDAHRDPILNEFEQSLL